ncbi:sensor histidine kinase [Trujillonella endophytica]|uniref:histidine kinase n=1 Tax=Trujillonella endophytica TaxID=673521 RepID=A0A1H8WF25_9ACTN|nr:histidine kinase [Trujillella endophytica]SEP25718.1 Signal transduction histidine kinase [Trujillella endophytica]
MGIRARLWPGLSARSVALEVLLALGSLGFVAIGAATPEAGLVPDPALVAGSLVLAGVLVVLRRRAPLVPYAASVVLAVLSTAVTGALLITAYAVGRYVGRWPARAVAAVAGLVAVSRPWAVDGGDEAITSTAGAALVVLLPGALGAWARTRAQLLEALRERAERAETERELLAREAVIGERTRIAREMHDVVGHRVSLMVLQAGAIEVAAADRERVEQLAAHVQEAGRRALEELRSMVGVLRADDGVPLAPQPGLESVPALVEQGRAAGMDVELRSPPDGDVDPAVGRAAYRIVQEALTNAAKHAPGAAVCVELARQQEELVVRIVNGPGREPAAGAPSGGYGLVGLAERVRTLDGRLAAGPRLDGGFAVEAVLPS